MLYIYGNMDPINIPQSYISIYTSTMDPMGFTPHFFHWGLTFAEPAG